MHISEVSNTLVIILSGIVVSLLGLIVYYVFFFSKLALCKITSPDFSNLKPVSVIIAARNEYENLQNYLTAILEQDYPEFEVIVVNDCSWDESQKLLEYYQEKYPHLKICKIVEQEKYPTGKKFALTIGVKAATYEHLVFTDADCSPASKNWLKHIAAQFKENKQIVLAHSPYLKTKGLLNAFARFENAITAMLYLNAAMNRIPFMGVGRNLAYTKQLFFNNKGFASHSHILSGDDDLFINEVATAGNTTYTIHPESFMLTPAKKTIDAYFRQKSRHITTGKFYKNKHKALLGGYFASLILFHFYVIIGFIYLPWQWPVIAIALKLLLQTIIFTPSLKKLGYKNLAWFLLFLDVLYVLYISYFGTKGLLTRNARKW
ncbi:MAG: glycosyltransferase [Bacteroidia bacterium]